MLLQAWLVQVHFFASRKINIEIWCYGIKGTVFSSVVKCHSWYFWQNRGIRDKLESIGSLERAQNWMMAKASRAKILDTYPVKIHWNCWRLTYQGWQKRFRYWTHKWPNFILLLCCIRALLMDTQNQEYGILSVKHSSNRTDQNIALTWSLWICSCCLRLEPELNFLLQNSHGKGFSPVCIRWWRIRLETYRIAKKRFKLPF